MNTVWYSNSISFTQVSIYTYCIICILIRISNEWMSYYNEWIILVTTKLSHNDRLYDVCIYYVFLIYKNRLYLQKLEFNLLTPHGKERFHNKFQC